MDKKVIIQFFAELLFPSFCLGCRLEGSYFCYDCRSTLDISAYRYCLCNRDPLRLPADAATGTCSRCKNRGLAGLYAALPYQEQALTRELVRQFKYPPRIRSLAKDLANIIAEHVAQAADAQSVWGNGIIVPVPAERSRAKERGYNQSEVLAKELSAITGLPLAAEALYKIKKTPPQVSLSAEERKENANGAYASNNRQLIAGKKVLLVDDVYTTGATMEACARALRGAGAASVVGIAFAREGLSQA